MYIRAVMVGLAGLAALAAGAGPAGAAVRGTVAAGAIATATTGTGALRVTCTAPAGYRRVVARLATDIAGALDGRAGDHAVSVYDQVTGISCAADGGLHFDSASIVKAIILAALLRWHQETGTPLSAWEQGEATLMITLSDNAAATGLWDEVGMTRLQQFLNLANMNETELGPYEYWGLTQATAHDEMLLLQLLTQPNSVLSAASRSYELGLMAEVTDWQRWGTPAGAPADVTVHVKNGWLPDGTGWHVNSIGAFTGKGEDYLIAVLTDDNPSEQYGIDTIEDIARQVHDELSQVRFGTGVRLAAANGPATAVSAAAVSAAIGPTATGPSASGPSVKGPSVTGPTATAPAAAGPAAPSPWAVVPALPTPPSPWAVVPALPTPPTP